MRAALERRSASTMMHISINVSFVGAHVDCSTKTSLPRTFSSSSTITSPSLNLETVVLPSWTFRYLATPLRCNGQRMPRDALRDESLHLLRKRVDHALRAFAIVERRENARPRT